MWGPVLWLCRLWRLHYNAVMSESPIDKLESQLEALIEGAFARMIRRPIRAREIAIMLLRALEEGAAPPSPEGTRAIAPDRFQIAFHPQHLRISPERLPELRAQLAQFIIELSAETGYQLNSPPQVSLCEDPQLAPHRVSVRACRTSAAGARTGAMPPVKTLGSSEESRVPQLTVDGDRFVQLTNSVVNIGRAESNDVVIADAFTSRHHLQLRKGADGYTLFDINSRSGTRVNDITVSEHHLQNGDVIQIGRSLLVYADAYGRQRRDGTTQALRTE